MFKPRVGNFYSVGLLEMFYLRCDTENERKRYLNMSVWRKDIRTDLSHDDGDRFVMQPIGSYAYRCHRIYNVNGR